jgi:TonB family protein
VSFVHRPARAVVELVIDESGAVQEAVVKQGLNPAYDAMVIRATRTWRYAPAMKDGLPVKFRRTIIITLK